MDFRQREIDYIIKEEGQSFVKQIGVFCYVECLVVDKMGVKEVYE